MAVNETLNYTLNASLNSTVVNASSNAFAAAINGFAQSVWTRFIELVSAPIHFPNMIWIVTPLVVATLLMQFYFGRYRHEELGWNTAVGNSLVLIFVSIDLLRFVYGDTGVNSLDIKNIPLYNFKATVIALVVGAAGFLMMFTNFFHILPKKFSFFMSSSLPVNLMSYIAITLVYTSIPLDINTLLAAFVLFIILLVFFNIIQLLEPKSDELS